MAVFSKEEYLKLIDKKKNEIATMGFSKEFVEWISKEIKKINTHRKRYDSIEAEYFEVDDVRDILRKIREEKPVDEKAYAELLIKRMEHYNCFELIRNKINELTLKDKARVGPILKEAEKLEQEVKQNDPEYAAMLPFDSIYSEAAAITSGGRMGSTAAMSRLGLIGIFKGAQKLEAENEKLKGILDYEDLLFELQTEGEIRNIFIIAAGLTRQADEAKGQKFLESLQNEKKFILDYMSKKISKAKTKKERMDLERAKMMLDLVANIAIEKIRIRDESSPKAE